MTMPILLPAEGALTLNAAEVADLTGAGTKSLQVQWLRDNGWSFTTSRHGEPRVGRLYANLKLGGVELSDVAFDKPPEDGWVPNYAALNR